MCTRPHFSAAFLSFALLSSVTTQALAQEPAPPTGERLRTGEEVRSLLASQAARLRTSAGSDPETVYVGKSFTNHTAPDNYWNLYAGTYRPGTNDPTNAMWDWDNTTGIQAPDSLQGWWPYRREYNLTGNRTLPDDQRPWGCVDHGNVGNYVLPAGSGAKRTFGVVGYWHDDPGASAGSGVRWSPLAGSRSAWCGMRQHGDLTVQDPVTGNYYSGEAVSIYGESNPFQQVVKRLPGYLDQMDQILYRDIAVPPGHSLTVSFLYRTRMSTSIVTAPATRAGWFQGDPLAVVGGNFISSSAAGTAAPQDSFMVYVGAPVNDAACVYSDGVTRPVYDKQRRWFSEVIKVFGSGASTYEIFNRAGNDPADTLAPTPTASVTIPSGLVANVLAASPTGVVRLVFRCKTNRGFSDADTKVRGYSSLGRGAVQVDNVTIDRGSGPELIGDFETPQQGGVNAIDNRFPLPGGLAATDVWRSTGKPLPVYMHPEALSGLTYNDICGPPGTPARLCNLIGTVMATGNHDVGEHFGDTRFVPFREARTFMMSPTINLVGGPGGTPNSQGITAGIAQATSDYLLWYDVYWGVDPPSFSGMFWSFGYQSYPAVQTGNGGKSWSDRHYSGSFFATGPECFTDVEGFASSGLPLTTSNASGVPDSLRLLIGAESQCFRFGIGLGCNSDQGIYFDNVALAFVDSPGVPGPTTALGRVTSDIGQFVNDAFPTNETPGLPGTLAFDTTAALIRTGINTAQGTGNALRFDIPGDSSVVSAGDAVVSPPDDPGLSQVRVDLVFRILPGPGNYQIAGTARKLNITPAGESVDGDLLQLPQNQAALAVSGDASFWGQYMADNGAVGTGGNGTTGPGHPGAKWSPLVWNSCRMDTTETNIFEIGSSGGSVPTGQPVSLGLYMTMIHESDPKFATLGVSKFKCFVVDTTQAAIAGPLGNNVVCDGTVPAYLTTVPTSRTGYDGSNVTKEYTKIVPDGLLTPGSHVQYFYRKSHAIDPLLSSAMCPDTNFITPQPDEGSTDKHRWQQFSVLPDRWKASTYFGSGVACYLYVDLDDRRGDEGRLVGVLDSICFTAINKRGAHNGWFAKGATNFDGLDVRTLMGGPNDVTVHRNAQPGTDWDMYGVKAVESPTEGAGRLGGRLANRTGMGFAAGRESRQGPTKEMLRAYYRQLIILTGDLNTHILGPFADCSQDDIALLNDYLTTSGGTAQPRGIFVQGDGFGESEEPGGIPEGSGHSQFLNEKLGVSLRSPNYSSLSGHSPDCVDLLTTTTLTGRNDIFEVSGSCLASADVWTPNAAIGAVAGAFYENVGLNGPYVSDVLKTATPQRNWVAVTSGHDIEHLFGRYCDNTSGRLAYYHGMFQNAFAFACPAGGEFCATLDVPPSIGPGTKNFMKVGNAVMRSGPATVRLGLAAAGRVKVCIYDVGGRRVRTLADRVFTAGEHGLQWDGTDDAGAALARGVYFVRSSNEKGAGRIIVLNR